jgi:uncharacterized membrane protein
MTLRRATLVLALLGAGVAGYLTWVHYAELKPICVGGGDACERVQSSEYALLLGVPIALLGLFGYAALLGTLALPEELGQTVAALLSLTGAAFSGYLTWVELAELNAVCQWCVVSALLMVGLAGVSVARLTAGVRTA